MKKLLLLAVLTLVTMSCDPDDSNEPAVYNMEGKWLSASNLSNTMYIFENGVRYTYYCTDGLSCLAQYDSFEAADGNHIPGTNDYTFENGILTIDLNFGNELVAPVTFECDGDKVYVGTTPNGFYLYRLGANCN
ncbi:hypothetical protein [uncultured Flavobacterium sp.]|jgi:hypothetical protein|uniref:hypothetical protein n=1 Tax=uncultured Flavobacterium sp. TaxID=165435 RepID=UPI0030CA286A